MTAIVFNPSSGSDSAPLWTSSLSRAAVLQSNALARLMLDRISDAYERTAVHSSLLEPNSHASAAFAHSNAGDLKAFVLAIQAANWASISTGNQAVNNLYELEQPQTFHQSLIAYELASLMPGADVYRSGDRICLEVIDRDVRRAWVIGPTYAHQMSASSNGDIESVVFSGDQFSIPFIKGTSFPEQ